MLIASPVCAALAMLIYVAGGLIGKIAKRNSGAERIIFYMSVGIFAELTITSMAFLLRRDTVGFIAPLYDAGWRTVGILNIIAVIIFVFLNGFILFKAKISK